MKRYQAGGASCVDGHGGTVPVKEVGDPVCKIVASNTGYSLEGGKLGCHDVCLRESMRFD